MNLRAAASNLPHQPIIFEKSGGQGFGNGLAVVVDSSIQ
jgi:hypothetical protein